MLNTDRQSQVSLLPSAVSCFKCMLVMLTLATNMYTNTEIHKYTWTDIQVQRQASKHIYRGTNAKTCLFS